jgi:acetylornithine/N-succinyldiaminopimelate aminotransferase
MNALMPTYARADLQIVRGDGAYLYDTEGRDYLDLASGIAVNALGHGDPRLVQALTDQASRLWHVSNLYRIPQQEALAEALCERTFADHVFFANSGAEAVEAALKTAKRWHYAEGRRERYRFITFRNAFHGRTIATISATDQEKIRSGFEPLLDWFDFVDFNDLDGAEAAIGPHTAGILVEPIQGEGGLTPVDPAFLRGLRHLCDDHGLILVFDEVQTGMGRTGELFAYQGYGVTPDIMAAAKGLGGGFPIGACLATARAAKGMTAGAHGSTFGGNPLGCAVGLAVLEAVTAPGFLQQVRETGEMLLDALKRVADRHPHVFTGVRGRGLMLGLQVTCLPRDFVNYARGFGLMTAAAGTDMVRILPPLNLPAADIAEAERRLDAAGAGWVEPAALKAGYL